MAGKTRRRAALSSMPRGHMELKSSALCTTDGKLVSQYLVVEHMAAHYKKLNEAKSRIDSTSPKAWAVSTKVRDRFRREALRQDISHHQAWLASRSARHSARASLTGSQGHRSPRAHHSARLDDRDFDDIDGATLRDHSPVGREDGATGRLRLSEDDLRLVNQIIQDSRTSPSKYHHKQMLSNIPPPVRGSKTGQATSHMTFRPPKSQLLHSYTASPNYLSSVALGRHQGDVTNRHVTPRGGDLLEKQAHKFTEEKPFMPRTLKTNCTSKLTEFKYYNPPPKKHVAKSWKDGRGSAGMLRSETPMTESVDLMHETLMSRDAARVPPSDIPPLDISLDADHLLWLKEQSKMAQLRKSQKYTTSRPTSSLSHHLTTGKSQKYNSDTKPQPKSCQSLSREDELRYLEFISDVTNDVLDRGIFTNRVLKQVFESHIEKRRGDLKESKMRDLLADLWKDLGISPDDDIVDTSPVPRRRHVDPTTRRQTPSDVTPEPSNPVPPPRATFRQRHSSPSSPSVSPDRSTLRAAPREKPPLPGGGSVRGQGEEDGWEEEDEEERRVQKETADMMAAILTNGAGGRLQPSDSLSALDTVDNDDVSVKEQDTVSASVVDNDVHAAPRHAGVAVEQLTCDSAEQDTPPSAVVKDTEEQVTLADSHFTTKQVPRPRDVDTSRTGKVDTDLSTEVDTDRQRQEDSDRPREVDTDRPSEVDTDRPGEMDTDRSREVDTDRPREVDTDRPREMDNDRRREVYTDRPREVNNDRQREVDTDRPREVDTDRPREVDTDHQRKVDIDQPNEVDTVGRLTNGKGERENADDREDGDGEVDERNTGDTEKDNQVFNNNENEKDTARSGGYTDDGWESNVDDESGDDDTLRGSGYKGKENGHTEQEDVEKSSPQATTRQTKPVPASRSDVKNATKSLEQTMSSESIDVSDLDEDDDDF